MKRKPSLEARQSAIAADEAAAEALKVKAEAAETAKAAAGEGGPSRESVLAELAGLKKEKEALGKELQGFKGNDPALLKQTEEAVVVAKAGADRWTDGTFSLKKGLVQTYGKTPAEADAMLGLGDKFDYVS